MNSNRSKKLNYIFSILLKKFNKQYWWPVTIEGEIQPKYHKKIRINEKQKLEICFGAILTQNTNWKNVEKAIINLNKNNLINVNKIIKINNKKLAQIIRSSGYHNQKAKKLKNFSYFLSNNFDSNINLLFKNKIGKLRNELLSINGIGPETADSIILYAAKKPIFVIDAYTKRIMNRIGYKEQTYEELQKLFMNLNNDEKLFNEYHALLVELGKNVCKKKPLCDICPLKDLCDYYKSTYLNNQEN